jgi:hypothetical protein
MTLHPSEIALLKDLALARSSWTSAAAEGLSNPNAIWIENQEAWSTLSACLQREGSTEAFTAVVSELLSGLIHSVLVSFDGGTALAETTILKIEDEEGHEFKRFLHEFWPNCASGEEV